MWALWSILAGLVWGTSNLAEKKLIGKSKQSFWGAFLLFESANAILTLPLAFIYWDQLQTFMWPILFATGLNLIGMSTYLIALQKEEVSRVVPLWLLGMVLIPLGDAIFLNHILNPIQYSAIAVMFILGFLLVLNKKTGITKSVTVFGLMLVSTSGYAGMWLLGDTVVDTAGPLQFTVGIYAARSVLLLMLVFFMRKRFEARQVLTGRNIGLAFAAALASLSGLVLFFQAMSGSSIPSLVEPFTTFQFMFIFLAPLAINKLWPGTFDETFDKKIVLQKSFLILGMIGCGLVLLLS